MLETMHRWAVGCVVGIAALVLASAPAYAADPYTGQIGRIDIRTGHADPATYRNGIIVRDTSSSVICVVAPDAEMMDQFVAVATAALLGGKSVTIERGGALNGQFKCYQIQVRR